MACCTIPIDPKSKDYTPKAHSSRSTAALIFSILFCTLPVGFFLAVTDLRKKSINYDHSCSALALCTIPFHILFVLMLANTYFSNPYHATALTDAFISYNESRSGAEEALSELPIASPGDTFDTGALLITLISVIFSVICFVLFRQITFIWIFAGFLASYGTAKYNKLWKDYTVKGILPKKLD